MRAGNDPAGHTRRGDTDTLKGSFRSKKASIVVSLIFWGRGGEELGRAQRRRRADYRRKGAHMIPKAIQGMGIEFGAMESVGLGDLQRSGWVCFG